MLSDLIRGKILKFSEDVNNIKNGLDIFIQAEKDGAPRGEFVGALLDRSISLEIINAFDILNEAKYGVEGKDFPKNLGELTTWVDRYTTELLKRDLEFQENLFTESVDNNITSILDDENNIDIQEAKRTL